MRIRVGARYVAPCVTALFAFSLIRASAQFRDDFDGASIDTSIWTVHAEPGFSIRQANGVLTFDADDVSDPSDTSWPDENFDNQWDKAYLLSTPFPRTLHDSRDDATYATQITFGVTVPVQTTAWFIGVIPEGRDPAIDPQLKFAYAWHYFWLGGGTNFFTFHGGPTWDNPIASPGQDPESGIFRITLDPVTGALWEIHDGSGWVTHWDQLGQTTSSPRNPFDTSRNYQVLLNYDGDENDLVVDFFEVSPSLDHFVPTPTPTPTQPPAVQTTGRIMLEDDFRYNNPSERKMPATSGPPAGFAELPFGNYDSVNDVQFGNVGAGWQSNQTVGDNLNEWDGVTNLRIPMNGTWNQYIDNRANDGTAIALDMTAGHLYAFVCVFTMPEGPGSESMGLTISGSHNSSGGLDHEVRVFNITNGEVFFSNRVFDAENDLATGQTIRLGQPQSLMMVIDDQDGDGTASISLHYNDGVSKNTPGQGWQNITPASDPLLSYALPINGADVGVNNRNPGDPGDFFVLDYLLLVEDPNLIPPSPPDGVTLRDADLENHPDAEWTNSPTVHVEVSGPPGFQSDDFVDLDEDAAFGSPTSYLVSDAPFIYTFDNETNEIKTVYARQRSFPEPEHVVSDTITLDTVAPEAPGAPTDAGDLTNDPLVLFEWPVAEDPAPGGIQAYQLQVGTTPDGNNLFDGEVGASTSHATLGPLGATVYARARAIDLAGNVGPWSESSDGILVNTPPAAPEVSITPVGPRTLDRITAQAEAVDADGHAVVEYRFEWQLDGQKQADGPELSPDLTAKNQQWRVSAWARDEHGLWGAAGGHEFVIHNSPPTQPFVEVKPQPASPGQDLIVDVQIYSTDPDGDPVEYDFAWFKSTDGGQRWIHKIELNGSPQVSNLFISAGELWQVQFTPFEANASLSQIPGASTVAKTNRIEGLYGFDWVYVGENAPPTFQFDVIESAWTPSGVTLDVYWTAADGDDEDYRVSLYWTDRMYSGLAPLREHMTPDQTSFSGFAAISTDRPVYLHALVEDAKGALIQVGSDALQPTNSAGTSWSFYD